MDIKDLPVNHNIIKKLADYGFTALTDIQQKCILPSLQGKDIMACSQTGSGKTLAFLIPAVHRLLTTKALSKQDPRILILAPTRELAKQVFIEAKKLVSGTRLSTCLIVGGENYNDQAKALRRSPDIIVATAGRIFDHLESRHFFLNGLELLILDEADRMLDLGFAEALYAINRYANHRKRQTLLFSATLDHVDVTSLSTALVNAPVRINIGLSTDKHADIHQTFYFAESLSQKVALLDTVLTEKPFNQAIVFTATRDDTSKLAESINSTTQLSAIALSGDLAQTTRSSVLNAFTNGQHDILVTTDLASRGLNITNVDLVINFDLPKQADEYIHRIGRTGRAGASGFAVSLVGQKDWQSFMHISQHIDYPISCIHHPLFTSRFIGNTAFKQGPKTKHQQRKQALKYGNGNKPKKPKRIDTLQGADAGATPILKIKKPID